MYCLFEDMCKSECKDCLGYTLLDFIPEYFEDSIYQEYPEELKIKGE